MNQTPYTDPPTEQVPDALLEALCKARHLLVFSGVGMSAESGIPTFRSNMHSLWAEFSAQELASPERWRADKSRVWAWYEWRRGLVSRAQPHAGHLVIPKLVVGTSGVDHAAGLPVAACKAGKYVVEINPVPSEFSRVVSWHTTAAIGLSSLFQVLQS